MTYKIKLHVRRKDDDPGDLIVKLEVDREEGLRNGGVIAAAIRVFELGMPTEPEPETKTAAPAAKDGK